MSLITKGGFASLKVSVGGFAKSHALGPPSLRYGINAVPDLLPRQTRHLSCLSKRDVARRPQAHLPTSTGALPHEDPTSALAVNVQIEVVAIAMTTVPLDSSNLSRRKPSHALPIPYPTRGRGLCWSSKDNLGQLKKLTHGFLWIFRTTQDSAGREFGVLPGRQLTCCSRPVPRLWQRRRPPSCSEGSLCAEARLSGSPLGRSFDRSANSKLIRQLYAGRAARLLPQRSRHRPPGGSQSLWAVFKPRGSKLAAFRACLRAFRKGWADGIRAALKRHLG